MGSTALGPWREGRRGPCRCPHTPTPWPPRQFSSLSLTLHPSPPLSATLGAQHPAPCWADRALSVCIGWRQGSVTPCPRARGSEPAPLGPPSGERSPQTVEKGQDAVWGQHPGSSLQRGDPTDSKCKFLTSVASVAGCGTSHVSSPHTKPPAHVPVLSCSVGPSGWKRQLGFLLVSGWPGARPDRATPHIIHAGVSVAKKTQEHRSQCARAACCQLQVGSLELCSGALQTLNMSFDHTDFLMNQW